jgi:hypothetical protein
MALVSGEPEGGPIERAVARLWWLAAHAWGLLVGAILVMAPLTIGVVVASLSGASPGISLALGTIAAVGLGLPPWNGESWRDALLAISGIVASWFGWQLLRDPDASLVVLEICVILGAAGWILRPLLLGGGRGVPSRSD